MTADEKIVEAVARAICHELNPVQFDDLPEHATYLERKTHVDRPMLDKDEARDVARAAIAALQAESWQPIETFDSSEAYVLVCDGYDVSEARYHPNEGGWWLANTHPTDAHDGQVYPTYWMPKPLPPTPKASP